MGFEDFLGEGNQQWMIIIPLIILIVFTFLFRRRKAERTEADIAGSLFFDVNANLRLVESFSFQGRPNKFKTASWQRNSGKVDFLDASLRSTLADTFSLAESFNQEIEAAKRYKSTTYLSAIDVDKLKEPLTKSRQGLEEWLKANIQQTGPEAGRRGCMPGGFGG